MNKLDLQRIENAIWTLKQYKYEIKIIAEQELKFSDFDCDKVFDILEEVEMEVYKECFE